MPLDRPLFTCASGLICVIERVIVNLYFRVDMCHNMCHHIPVLSGMKCATVCAIIYLYFRVDMCHLMYHHMPELQG